MIIDDVTVADEAKEFELEYNVCNNDLHYSEMMAQPKNYNFNNNALTKDHLCGQSIRQKQQLKLFPTIKMIQTTLDSTLDSRPQQDLQHGVATGRSIVTYYPVL